MQSNNKTSFTEPGPNLCAPVPPRPTPLAVSTSQKTSRRRGTSEDEIDAVFKATLGNKTKKAAVDRVSALDAQQSTDQQMSEVLGAIREAPSGESGRTKRRKVN